MWKKKKTRIFFYRYEAYTATRQESENWKALSWNKAQATLDQVWMRAQSMKLTNKTEDNDPNFDYEYEMIAFIKVSYRDPLLRYLLTPRKNVTEGQQARPLNRTEEK